MSINSNSSNNLCKEDDVLFGSLNSVIADHMADRIDAALSQGLKSLPLMYSDEENHQEERRESLKQSFQKIYSKNVDLLEIYASRNIFTVSKFPPSKRQAIVERYFNDNSDKMMIDDEATDDKTSCGESINIQHVSEIPTGDQMQALQNELLSLQERCQGFRRRRQEIMRLGSAYESLEQLELETNMDKNQEALHQTVAATVQQSQTLQQLQARSQQVLLQEQQRRGDSMEEDKDECVWSSHAAKHPTKSKTLSEQFEADQGALDTSVASLEAVYQMIRQQGEEENQVNRG